MKNEINMSDLKIKLYKKVKTLFKFYSILETDECFQMKKTKLIKGGYIITKENTIIKSSPELKFEAFLREYMKKELPTIFSRIWDGCSEDSEIICERTSEFVSYLLANGFVLYDGEHREFYIPSEYLNINQMKFINVLKKIDICNTIKSNIESECKYSEKKFFTKRK